MDNNAANTLTAANEEIVYENLQLNFEDRELYLVKVPPSLGEAWKQINESDLTLGSVELEEPDAITGRQTGLLRVNSTNLNDDLPTEYKIDMTPTDMILKVFSQDGSGRLAVEGSIKNSGVVMPQRNSQYSKLCKKRLLKSMIKDRFVKPLEDLPRPRRGKMQFTIDKAEEESDEEETASERFDKRVKLGKEELKNLIFHHFEERNFWPLKELNMHCRQPESYLKEIMKEICLYHRKGPNKSCYELKPQYKHHMMIDAKDE